MAREGGYTGSYNQRWGDSAGALTASNYTRTYTSFSGCDIIAAFGNSVIGELQAITYSIQREKAPILYMSV